MTVDSNDRARLRRKPRSEAEAEDKAVLAMTDDELRDAANLAAESLSAQLREASRDDLIDYLLALKRIEILGQKADARRRLRVSELEGQQKKAALARDTKLRKDWKRLEGIARKIFDQMSEQERRTRGARETFRKAIARHLNPHNETNCIRNDKTATNQLWPWLIGRTAYPPSARPSAAS